MEKTRNYLFDNIKALMIFLVVAVHLLASVGKATEPGMAAKYFMLFACSFHMPVFLFISGYFSKKAERAREQAYMLFLQYGMVQVAMYLWTAVAEHRLPKLIELIAPAFSMWYLLVLAVLKLTLKDLARIKGVLFWAALLSVAAMSIVNRVKLETALVKLLANAIYFLLGYYTTEAHLAKLRRIPKPVWLLLFALCMAGVWLVSEHDGLTVKTLRMMMLRNMPIVATKVGRIAYLYYLYIFVNAVVAGMCIIGFTGEKRTFLSTLGKNTMTVYIAQAFVKLALDIAAEKGMLFASPTKNTLLALALSAAVCALFGNNLVANAYSKAVNGVATLLFKKEKTLPRS